MKKTALRLFTLALSSTLLISNVYANDDSPLEGGGTVKNAIEYYLETDSYKLFQDVNFETLSNTIQGDKVTVDGNGYNIDGEAKAGLTITAGQVYNFTNVGDKTAETLKGFNNFDKPNDNGGTIDNAGELTITNSVLTNNKASRGGAIYNTGELNISNSIFLSNETTGANILGGAIYSSSSGSLTIDNSKFIDNSANTTSTTLNAQGGAIMTFSKQGNITNSEFLNNKAISEANSYGGAINHKGITTISNSTFFGNEARQGGAIYNALNGTIVGTGILTINDSTFKKKHCKI